jgi:hypothetical protein
MSYLGSAGIVILIIGVAWFLARIIARKRPTLINTTTKLVAILLGTGLVLTAAVGKLGWSIQSWQAAPSPREVLNTALFWILSQTGSFLIFLEVWCNHMSQNNKPERQSSEQMHGEATSKSAPSAASEAPHT